MKFSIMHESKQRMRIRLPQKSMSIFQADMFLYYIEALDFVKEATVFERTAGSVIHYKEGKREALIQAIKSFSYDDEDLKKSLPENSGRKLKIYYQDKFVNMLIFKIVRDLFLPMSFNIAYTIYKSIGYILEGIKSLLKLKLEVSVLDALSILISIFRGDYSTAGSVMFLLGTGNLLEEWTHKKSLNDLARSMALNIDKVWIKSEDMEIQVPISRVKEGDSVVIHTGNMIPLDGKVVSGEAMVNQASLTGEAVAVAKNEGTYVYAGTVVEEGELLIQVKSGSGSGRYDKIVSMIEESEKLKSHTESKASILADKLVPYTLAGTALTYLFTRNITKALSVLMVDFSCALKLSMPLAVLSAMRESGKYNITVKGGKFLEAVANADTVVFDKTGTLTYATPTVEKIVTFSDYKEREMLKIAACLEEHYPHSMAKAVVNYALKEDVSHKEMHSQVEYVVAHGISSKIDGVRVIIGSHHFVFEDENIQIRPEDKEKFDSLEPRFSHLYMAIGGQLAAVICISDPLRKEAKDVLKSLKKLGIKKTVMMTGDNRNTAAAIAAMVGVDEFYAEVLPEDKASFIEKEKAKGKTVIMIGDGINDSPALSAADCGIAISEGAAIAREIADITIAANDLNELILLKTIANRLMKRVDNNYKFVIGFNSFLIALGVWGIFAPTTTALWHNISTVGVSMINMTNLLD